MTGRLTATCRTQALQTRTASSDHLSGIDKAAVNGVVLTPLGVEGDRVLDTAHHGGVDKAAYAYGEDDVAWWVGQLEEEIPAGRFGENLRVEGIAVTGAVIGERWRIGDDVVVEVSEPRVPCATFQHHMDDRSGWVKRFTKAGRTGAYLRVLTGGHVRAGDPVEVAHRPDHGVTIGGWFTTPTPEDARALLAAESQQWRMADALRHHVVHLLGE